MSEMRNRAAEAIWLAGFSPGDNTQLSAHFKRSMTTAPHLRDATINQAVKYADVALLAALDPEDEALVEAVARSIMVLDLDDAFGEWQNHRLKAVAAIAAMNREAQRRTQGERLPE